MDLINQLQHHARQVKFDAGKMPTLAQWKDKSRVGSLLGPPYRRDDPTLRWIDHYVQELQHAHGGARSYLLAELFFTTMSWLHNHGKDPVRMQAGRRQAILGLNLHAATLLAATLGCTTRELAAKLHDIYGIGLTSHGRTTDANHSGGSQEMYEKGVKFRESFRIFFKHGLAYTFTSAGSHVLLDTYDATLNDDEQFDNRPGRRFVMSLSGGLFASNQASLFSYHSCFMGGGAVLCAGTLLCSHGRITRIRNDSGHYQPVDVSMAKVLARLRTQGVDLSRMIVVLERASRDAHAKGGDEVHVNALQFLNQNGNWPALMQGRTVGRTNAGQRCQCTACKTAKVLV